MTKDIRWQQRFVNLNKAFLQLERFIEQDNLNEMEAQGLIKAFEYTYELSWKTLQDLLKAKGYNDIVGPRPVLEQSFQDGYLANGKAWMAMHKSRNLTAHAYDEDAAKEVIDSIRSIYFQLFRDLRHRLEQEQCSEE